MGNGELGLTSKTGWSDGQIVREGTRAGITAGRSGTNPRFSAPGMTRMGVKW